MNNATNLLNSIFAQPSTSDPNTITTSLVLDSDGDLLLRAWAAPDSAADLNGATWAAFQVCSATLRRASPVWKAMLFGPWTESKQSSEGKEWIVSLPEDSPATLKIVLAILHGQFELVPEKVDIPTFSDILVLTDKYDLRGVIQPWTRRWVEAIDWSGLEISVELVQAAHIAWELGLEEKLLPLVMKLVLDGSLEGVRDQRLFGSVIFSGEFDFSGFATRRRAWLIRKLFKFYADKLESLTQQTLLEGCQLRGVDDAERQLCCRVILGGFLSYLAQGKSKAPRKAAQYTESATQLMELLSAMYSEVITLPRHEVCNPKHDYVSFQEELLKRRELTTMFSLKEKKEMERRKDKAGL